MDPRIRIRIQPKMSWIRNTGGGEEEERLAIGLEDVKEAARRSHVLYDRTGDQHYFMASALQKSIRGQGLDVFDYNYFIFKVQVLGTSLL
jgi:replication-associated recombination protein RarA